MMTTGNLFFVELAINPEQEEDEYSYCEIQDANSDHMVEVLSKISYEEALRSINETPKKL